MRLLILTFLILTAQITLAMNLSEWKKAVVKVKSYPCRLKVPVFEGTGFFVNVENKIQVITSDHIIYQSKKHKTCIKIYSESFKNKNVKSYKVDVLNGLALLRIEQEISSSQLVDLNQQPSNINSFESIIALGFPAGSDLLLAPQKGRLVSTKNERALIPSVKKMLEIASLPVEFGMSGGPILGKDSSGNYEFVGVTTHQSVSELSLAIPRSFVTAWISQMNLSNHWKRDYIGFDKSFSYGIMNLTEEFVDSNFLKLGGSDGSGVGGEESFLEDHKKVITLSLERGKIVDLNFFKEHPLLEVWANYLLKGMSVNIVMMVKKEENEYIEKSISSLEQVLTLWLRDDYKPIIYLGKNESIDYEVSARDQNVQELLSVILELKLSVINNLLVDQLYLLKWLKSIETQALYVSNFVMANSELTFFFQREQDKFWNELYVLEFEKTIALSVQLRGLMTRNRGY